MQKVTFHLEQNYFWSFRLEDRSITEKTSSVGRETGWYCTDGGDSCHEDGAEPIDGEGRRYSASEIEELLVKVWGS